MNVANKIENVKTIALTSFVEIMTELRSSEEQLRWYTRRFSLVSRYGAGLLFLLIFVDRLISKIAATYLFWCKKKKLWNFDKTQKLRISNSFIYFLFWAPDLYLRLTFCWNYEALFQTRIILYQNRFLPNSIYMF